MSPTPSMDNPRFPELDGLRALAVISVIAFHCEIPGLFNAGFFGVDMFFAISGFIITAILFNEYRQSGHFKIVEFYFRRMKRLLPPVLGLIAVSFLITPLISEMGYAGLKSDVPSALLYFSNWQQIFSSQPYFEAAEAPRMLKHLWSLAVEEQFYIAWPPLAYFFLKKFGRQTTGLFALMLALASTVWMCYLHDDGDPNRVYLGTDTHAMGLLAGAALACFWNPWAAQKALGRRERIGLQISAALSLTLLGAMIWAMNQSHPLMYRGSFLLVPGLTCAIAYCTLNDQGSLLSRLLRSKVIQWTGSRSYSLYLVHWFVFTLMRLHDVDALAHWNYLAAGLLMTGLISEVSYRTLERQIKMRFNHVAGTSKAYTMGAYTVFAGAVLLQSARQADHSAAVQPATGAPAPVTHAAAERTALPVDDNAAHAGGAAAGAAVELSEKSAGGEHMYAIGDSVLLGASAYLLKSIPGIHIDAAVGRQASQGLKIVSELHGTAQQANTILLHLGTNGYISESQFKDLLRALAHWKSVLVMNVHANRPWTTPNNAMIERITRDFPNAHLINWHSVSSGRPDYFVKDGIHLTQAGIFALTAQIKLATGAAAVAAPGAARNVSNASLQVLTLAQKTALAEDKPAAVLEPTAALPAMQSSAAGSTLTQPPSAAGAPLRQPADSK